MAPPTEPDDILAAEQKKEEKNKDREERKKAEAEKKKKEAEEEAMKLRNAQLELANSIRFKRGRPGNNRQPAVSRAKQVSTSKKSDKAQSVALLGMRLDCAILKMGRIEKIAPVINNVDQSAAAASISSSTGSEILIGQVPIRLPFSSEEIRTSDQEMNKNVELALEKDNNVNNNNAEAETVPGTNVVSATLPVEEIDDLNAVPETNQYANAIDVKEIPQVSGADATLNHEKSNDDDSFEATGNEAVMEEEQNESNGEAIFLGAPTTSVPLQEEKYNMNDVPESPETNQFANATDREEIPLVPKTTMNIARRRWSDETDDDDFEAGGNEVMTEEEQNDQPSGEGIVLGSTTTTMTTSAPVQEENNINNAPETSQFEDIYNMRDSLVIPKANMDQAKNGNDDKFEVVKRKKVRKEKPNAHNNIAADQKEEKNKAIKADAGEEKKKTKEESRNARLEHNQRLLARAKFVATNAEAIILGTSPEAESITSQHSEGDSTEDVPETNRSTDLMNMKGPEAKSSNGDEKHKAKAGGEEVPKAEDKKASNTEGTKKTNMGKKAETSRKECYNKFSLLLEESETEVTKIEAKRVEKAANITGEKPHESGSDAKSVPEKEEDAEAANGVEEVAIAKKKRHKKKRKAEVTANITEEKPQSSCEEKVEETTGAPETEKEYHLRVSEEERDQEANRVEEAAAAEIKRAKRERKKKKKKKKAGKPGKSCLSVGLLPYVILAGLLVYNFLQVI